MEQAPTMYLLVDHALPGMEHALYKIELPHDLSDYDRVIDSDGFMTDSKNISSPVLTFNECNFLPGCASVTFGPKIYFLGGFVDPVEDESLHRKVQFFDTEHPERGLRTVSPLNHPKESTCVFVADGMIYALGSRPAPTWAERKSLPGCKGTGCFERYDPSLDQWQVLSDPPLSNSALASGYFADRTTVVGRRVFIGSQSLCAVFNLDDLVWEQLPPPKPGHLFYHASLFVKEQEQDSAASLYHLHIPDRDNESVQVLKNGPLALTTTTTDLLYSPCLDIGKGQVVAEGTELEDMFFAHYHFNPYRNLLHMGGRFFCYVASAQLSDSFDYTHFEPKSRGVWIKFLEDVSAETHDGSSETKFRTLASFCYKIDTNFPNRDISICCSVLGTVPDSWIKAPLEKKLVIKPKPDTRRKTLQIQSMMTPTVQEVCKFEQRHHEVENAEKREAKDDKKLITVLEENRLLVAELARMKELMKTYEISFDKSRPMVNVNSE